MLASSLELPLHKRGNMSKRGRHAKRDLKINICGSLWLPIIPSCYLFSGRHQNRKCGYFALFVDFNLIQFCTDVQGDIQVGLCPL